MSTKHPLVLALVRLLCSLLPINEHHASSRGLAKHGYKADHEAALDDIEAALQATHNTDYSPT